MNQVSTSTSPFSCKICNQKAHGNHFGVISCRACAAFFRRTAGSKYSKMSCRGGSCDKEAYLCKPCRLQKCRDMGMDSTKFQYSRDGVLVVPGQFQLPNSMETYVGRPEFLLFCGSESPSDKLLIDVRYLIEEAGRLLSTGPPLIFRSSLEGGEKHSLKKLTLAFHYIRLDVDKIKRVDYAGRQEMMSLWEHYFITVTKWILYFDEFQKLNRHIQLTLLQAIWHVWEKLHKYVSTAAYRKWNPSASCSEIIIKDIFFDMSKTTLDSSWMSDYPNEEVLRYLSHGAKTEFDTTAAIQELDLSEIELTYMFAQLCFHYAGKRYQGDILKVTDKFQQLLSDDLHDYYVNDAGTPRYFYRMGKMMKINNHLQRSIWESRPKMELGRIFNVIKLEFSHPEMFEDSGFC